MNKQKINYQKKLDKVLENLVAANGLKEHPENKPSLLLHACCGPCSSYCLEYLTDYFNITVLYYNPNIYPEKEYNRRFNELKRLYKEFPPAINGNVKVVELPYIPEDFYGAVKTREEPELAGEPEKGIRCSRCYELRLRASFNYALKNKFDYFCTTLSISPFKDGDKINSIGAAIEQEAADSGILKAPQWLVSDFKKKGGFKRSLELSDEYNMYRQEYCGCIYSFRSREEYEKSLKERNDN